MFGDSAKVLGLHVSRSNPIVVTHSYGLSVVNHTRFHLLIQATSLYTHRLPFLQSLQLS